jgi:hypothetical protein
MYAAEDIDIEKKTLDKLENRVTRRKVDVINKHIFRSMANLTVLIEKMQQDLYIRERFEDDLKALFLGESAEIENKEPIFLRFLKACVCESPQGVLSLDFRLILCHYMQWAVYDMITHTKKFKNKDSSFPLENVLFDDIKRSLAWTNFLSADRIPEFDKDTRPPLF